MVSEWLQQQLRCQLTELRNLPPQIFLALFLPCPPFQSQTHTSRSLLLVFYYQSLVNAEVELLTHLQLVRIPRLQSLFEHEEHELNLVIDTNCSEHCSSVVDMG
jgi:hypothetical protein